MKLLDRREVKIMRERRDIVGGVVFADDSTTCEDEDESLL